MFGKPQWFRDKTFGWGLAPITWQGWVYTAVWMMVLLAPFFLLLSRENAIGATVWIWTMIAALIYDVYLIKRARKTGETAAAAKKDSVLYISDDEAVQTKNLDLHLRR